MAALYAALVRTLSRQWGRALEVNFRVGELIDQIHERYSREASYGKLSKDLAEIGTKVSADTLRCYHQAYLLHRWAPRRIAKRLVDLPHSRRRMPEVKIIESEPDRNTLDGS